MIETDGDNRAQAAHWNARAGRTWAELGDMLDGLFAPFVSLLVDEIGERASVLDVGCGAGAVTLAAARQGGPARCCLGADISAPLVAAAKDRAVQAALSNAEFVQADAQTYPFAPASFDAIVSRFGVMFFADPVAAFRNLKRAARPRAKLACVAWRSAEENPFMTTAERAAAALLPEWPRRAADGPGQFAFADDARVRRILEHSGWQEIAIRPLDVTCTMKRQDLRTYAQHMGPLGELLPNLDAAARAEVLRRVDAAFQPFVDSDAVRFTAACWMVTARA
ncbi:class I SAM-dependent methyltransferase [Sphingosinicella sp. LY1275]|uniref:class I SAM-dependent methyltransferase n=1 Tax=Sphingosinicella sp. LY1275 TaxID=3095379 RepID=UPI002ADEA6B2|nr:methyltransferase domain-containing protein [Sphingosinicella sp. LY1275]MEA1013949.1 methyltransferase domain-containing protein [Sphingosinicella sp. LY1275]